MKYVVHAYAVYLVVIVACMLTYLSHHRHYHTDTDLDIDVDVDGEAVT